MGKINVTNLRKAYYYMRKNGLRAMSVAARERMMGNPRENETYIPITKEELERQKCRSNSFGVSFSVLVPVFHTPEKFYREMIESVLNQTYKDFELILADAGKEEKLQKIAESYQDERIRYVNLEENRGISENTNAALALAKNDYVALLDHDDLYTPDALFSFAEAIEESHAHLLYSDEDKCNGEATSFYEVFRKEDFNFDLLLSNNYICHLLVMKREDMQSLRFRSRYDGAQDYDITLREAALCRREGYGICHIPKVLYHWRCHESSTAANPESKRYAYEAGLNALKDFFETENIKAQVNHSLHLGFYDVKYLPDMFSQRADVGAIGGRILDKRKRIVGGKMTKDGIVCFEGLKDGFSGYRNQATLLQNAEQLDLRSFYIRPSLIESFRPLLEQLFDTKWSVDEKSGQLNIKFEENDTSMMENCTIINQRIVEMGYCLVYDPQITVKMK